MNLRLASEREYHDAEAARRAETFALEPHRWRFTDGAYLDHAPWVRPAFDRLGEVAGRRVLDLGCGHGMAAVVLARHGAKVSACDLSAGYVLEARQRAAANEAVVDFAVCDAQRLPFGDASFDDVWGHAILHHLDVAVAARELRRVLRPAGTAVFCEPWAGNPLVGLARRWRRHTEHEQALNYRDIQELKSVFGQVDVRFYQWRRYAVIRVS